MNKDQCCNHDCNQGRKCPVREGTHKPAEAVHQIQEPAVNQQLTIEREAFEEWVIKEYPSIRLDRKGDGYRYALVEEWWTVWKARAALAATPAAAPVVLPEPVPTPCRSMFATQREYADAMAQHRKNWAEIEAERGMLATGGQAQAVEQAPVLYVSKGQLDNHRDPDGPDSANAGRYLPARITPAGNFTMPLFAAPQAQAEHIKALIEVSRMPNQEHVADAHNAAVRHLRAIAAAKGEA